MTQSKVCNICSDARRQVPCAQNHCGQMQQNKVGLTSCSNCLGVVATLLWLSWNFFGKQIGNKYHNFILWASITLRFKALQVSNKYHFCHFSVWQWTNEWKLYQGKMLDNTRQLTLTEPDLLGNLVILPR